MITPAGWQEEGSIGQEVWQRILDALSAATGWTALLADEQARVLRSSGKGYGSSHLGPELAGAVRGTVGEGRFGTVREHTATGERVWMVVPVRFAPVSGAIVAGGLPPISPDAMRFIGDEHVAAAAAILDAILSSFGAVYSAARGSYESELRHSEAIQRRTTALYEMSALVNSVHDTRSVVSAVLRETVRLFGAARGAVLLPDEDDRLRCVDDIELPPGICGGIDELFATHGRARVALARPLYSRRVADDPALAPLREAALAAGIGSVVLAPFVHRGVLLGVLALLHHDERAYLPDELDAIALFANQVAVALVNARLFEESDRQLRRSLLLAELGRRLGATLDQREVLDSLVATAPTALGQACAVYLRRNGNGPLALSASHDARPGLWGDLQGLLKSPDLDLNNHRIATATARGKWLLVGGPGDTRHDGLLTALEAHSYISVPLLSRGEPIGVLLFWLFDEVQRFQPEDVSLAEAIADRASTALENARLYENRLRAEESKDEFLSSVSHELRTPLTAILGYSQLIRKSLDGQNVRLGKQMDIVWSQAQRLNRLVETVLDISNIEQGQLSLNQEPLELGALLGDVLDKTVTANADVSIDVRRHSGPLWLLGDRLRLEQVFSALLSNAVKYSPRGGTVALSVWRDGDSSMVEVADSGPGIDQADLEQVFDRYYKGETPLSRAGGLGLGLYVSRAFVEAHGGNISVKSSPGAGAIFRVALPLAPIVQ